MCNFKGAYVTSTLRASDLQCRTHAIGYSECVASKTRLNPIFCPWLIKYGGKSGFFLLILWVFVSYYSAATEAVIPAFCFIETIQLIKTSLEVWKTCLICRGAQRQYSAVWMVLYKLTSLISGRFSFITVINCLSVHEMSILDWINHSKDILFYKVKMLIQNEIHLIFVVLFTFWQKFVYFVGISE